MDFSEHMLDIASRNLSKSGTPFRSYLVKYFPLPFTDQMFDLILCYETIEHIPLSQRTTFVSELSRVLKSKGWMILTCPNVLWEPVHWLAAIFNIHHSEGPHRFLKRDTLISLLTSRGFEVVRENSTVILPFSSKHSIYLNTLIERKLSESIKRNIALRHSFILRKI